MGIKTQSMTVKEQQQLGKYYNNIGRTLKEMTIIPSLLKLNDNSSIKNKESSRKDQLVIRHLDA